MWLLSEIIKDKDWIFYWLLHWGPIENVLEIWPIMMIYGWPNGGKWPTVISGNLLYTLITLCCVFTLLANCCTIACDLVFDDDCHIVVV